MGRPFASLYIQALEAILASNPSNAAVLADLLHELQFRETPRARKLREDVAKRLESLKCSTSLAPAKAVKPAIETIPTTESIEAPKLVKLCERCHLQPRKAKDGRYCKECEKQVKSELKEAGYLRGAGGRRTERTSEQRENTYETKHGTGHG